jgi:hypothetical protein
MTKHQLDVYDTFAALEAIVEAIDDSTAIDIIPYMENGRHKFILRQPGGS